VSQAGEILLINSQAENLFGYDREDLLGHSVERLIPDPFQVRHLDHRAAYLSDPRARPMGAGLELYAVRKDGQEFPVEISLSPWGCLGKPEGLEPMGKCPPVGTPYVSDTPVFMPPFRPG
jgi:PAS domain S-box-containing protein